MPLQDHISPAKFFAAFQAVALEKSEIISRTWSSSRDYTGVMRAVVFDAVAKHLGLEYYGRDYYTLDGIFFSARDKKHFPGCSTYAAFIEIALEHENNPVGTAVEINKLQLFNAPLKVLVTYPCDPQYGKKLLDKYKTMIDAADVFGDFSTLRRQLVIFGYGGAPPSWEAHEYRGGEFTQLS